ncbi:hypothetical protein KAX35_02450, partial [candidate division WOR-3 bacterium]|nr:hypothetical protein [candidate division WOR-3 bacterium]
TVKWCSISLSLTLGLFISFITSLFAIKFLFVILERATLRPFSYYCFSVGVLSILFGLLFS